jgi:hypothetical protein
VLGESGELEVGYPLKFFSLRLPNDVNSKLVVAKPIATMDATSPTGPLFYWEILPVVLVLMVVAIVSFLVFRKLRRLKAAKANGQNGIAKMFSGIDRDDMRAFKQTTVPSYFCSLYFFIVVFFFRAAILFFTNLSEHEWILGKSKTCTCASIQAAAAGDHGLRDVCGHSAGHHREPRGEGGAHHADASRVTGPVFIIGGEGGAHHAGASRVTSPLFISGLGARGGHHHANRPGYALGARGEDASRTLAPGGQIVR